jgi:hypothetical protein
VLQHSGYGSEEFPLTILHGGLAATAVHPGITKKGKQALIEVP